MKQKEDRSYTKSLPERMLKEMTYKQCVISCEFTQADAELWNGVFRV